MDLSKLVVGDKVCVMRRSSNYGTCTVTKVGKLRIKLTRNSDGQEYQFSLRTGCVVPSRTGGYVDHYMHITTIEEAEKQTRIRERIATENHLWSKIENAARARDAELVSALLDDILNINHQKAV
jgi:hypothetical protein